MKTTNTTSGPAEQNTEQKILAAAEELFLEKGYALTSTVEIARKAGCNQALVHYYFRTKEKLFEAIFATKVRKFVTSVLDLDAQSLSFEQTLARIVESHFDIMMAQPRLPFLIMNELTTNPARIESLKGALLDIKLEPMVRLNCLLQQEIAKGNVRPTTMLDIGMTLASLNVMVFISRPIITRMYGMSDEEYEEVVKHRRKENVEIILRSLRP